MSFHIMSTILEEIKSETKGVRGTIGMLTVFPEMAVSGVIKGCCSGM